MTWKKEYNQTRQTYLTQKQRERRKQQKIASKKQELEQSRKYYEAGNIRILLSLKNYTELNTGKRKLWMNFCWAFKDLNEKGFSDIIQIMKLRESADNLIRDYWETAKKEISQGKSWNSLDEEQQTKFIKHWAREKARKEKDLASKLEQQEKQAKHYEREIELAKFHEERGKQDCKCWNCAESQKIRSEIKAEIERELAGENEREKKEQCSECSKWVKQLDEENGMCKSCVQQFSD